jgi:hypothetical protein
MLATCASLLPSILPWLWPLRGQNTIRKNALDHSLRGAECEQYDRYLKSFRYSKTYAAYGEFRSFILLFVTLQEARIENIRGELSDLPQDLSMYYRLTTFDKAMGDFLGAIWKSRLFSDTTIYPLVRESAVTT